MTLHESRSWIDAVFHSDIDDALRWSFCVGGKRIGFDWLSYARARPWRLWSAVAQWVQPDKRRETYLSIFGPLLLLMLLSVWATGMITRFAMIHSGIHTPLNISSQDAPFHSYLYLSGTTFFTLGLGDVTPAGCAQTALVVVEAGIGFGFPGGRHCLSSSPLSSVYPSRGEYFAPRRARRITPQRWGIIRRHGQGMKELVAL